MMLIDAAARLITHYYRDYYDDDGPAPITPCHAGRRR